MNTVHAWRSLLFFSLFESSETTHCNDRLERRPWKKKEEKRVGGHNSRERVASTRSPIRSRARGRAFCHLFAYFPVRFVFFDAVTFFSLPLSLRGAMVNRTYGTHKNLHISLFLLLRGTIVNRTYGLHKNLYI